MKRFRCTKPYRATKHQAGVAAVELALLLPIFLWILTMGFFSVSIFWHYTMVQKAAQDAARYLSTVSAAEMMAPAQADAAGLLAQNIARQEIAEIFPSSSVTKIEAFCDDSHCGAAAAGTVPATVHVKFSIAIYDPTGFVDVGWYGFPITASYTMRYAGT